MSLPAITPIPDYIKAVLKYWREQTSLTTSFPTLNIMGRIPDSATYLTYYLTVDKTGGGNESQFTPDFWPRVDVRCYGPNELSAMNLWRYVHPTLIPNYNSGHCQIEAANCRILSVLLEGGPNSLIDPNGNWPFVLATYRFHVLKVAV